MRVYVDDVTEDYGDSGIRVYSLVHGMDAYVAEVRASGIDIYPSDKYNEHMGELSNEHPLYETLFNAIAEHVHKEEVGNE